MSGKKVLVFIKFVDDLSIFNDEFIKMHFLIRLINDS